MCLATGASEAPTGAEFTGVSHARHDLAVGARQSLRGGFRHFEQHVRQIRKRMRDRA
jgi:hypothetical protein